MKKEIISHNILEIICHKEQEKNYRNRIKKMKSTLSLSPKTTLFLTKNIKTIYNKNTPKNFTKSLSSNNLETIELLSNKNYKTNKNKFISNELKLKIFNIAQDNLRMYKRLLDRKNKSVYDKKILIGNYKNLQAIKKNVCEYPCIDFFKKKRIEKYYKTLNNNDKNLNTVFDNINKYLMPKVKGIDKITYDKLFFSNEVKNELITRHRKNKLSLNTLNINNNFQRKKINTNLFFNTCNSLRNNYNNKDIDIETDKEQDMK